MSDLAVIALPGAGPLPTMQQMVEGRKRLAIAQATETIAMCAYENPARGQSFPPTMVREVERLALGVFSDIWKTHGMASINQAPYEIQHYRTDLITTRVLVERQAQRDQAVVRLGNGCCQQPGCPLNVFHRAILQTLDTLGETKICRHCGVAPENLQTCGRCRAIEYCSVECQRLDWKRHKTACTPPNPSAYQPVLMRRSSVQPAESQKSNGEL
jgi:hypothetical protein